MPWVLPKLPIAGQYTELVLGFAGTMVVMTGLGAGTGRALAILGGASPDRVELMTAVGFMAGVASALVLFAVDAVWG